MIPTIPFEPFTNGHRLDGSAEEIHTIHIRISLATPIFETKIRTTFSSPSG